MQILERRRLLLSLFCAAKPEIQIGTLPRGG
jgi:hypothetical protein